MKRIDWLRMQKNYSVSYFFFFWKLSGVVFWKDLCRKKFVKERGNKSIFSYILTAAGTIDCFECNSWDDPRCHDPFNYTIHKEHMPPIVECEGCCVKMVQFIGTGKSIHWCLFVVSMPLRIAMKQSMIKSGHTTSQKRYTHLPLYDIR